METLVLLVIVVLAVLVLFGIGTAPPPPAPPTPQMPDILSAERSVLLTKIDLEMQAAEIRLRSSGLTQAAEGAALTRARVIEFLKGYK